MKRLRMVFCTFPDAETARQIGTTLVEMQLAACVNLLTGVESIYRWQGKVEQSAEVLAIFKTSMEAYPEFAKTLAALHPYEVPEVVAIEPDAVSESYAHWLIGEVAVPKTCNESP